MKKYLFVFIALILNLFTPVSVRAESTTMWTYQCIDTMKYSRDASREWKDSKDLNVRIEQQVSIISSLGANCVAIATPYDEEFVPVLTAWVNMARKYKLRVWFRGNFSGWEGWFGYPRFKDPSEHVAKTSSFIKNHKDLFQEGDIFTPAPEAENGMLGDPRFTAEKRAAFNKFLLESYKACTEGMKQISSKALCGYFSVNGDVGRESLDIKTVETIGQVVIDHYVSPASRYYQDVNTLYEKYKRPVFLGEIGAPIPDIHGNMDGDSQAKFMRDAFYELYRTGDRVSGVNYWVLSGGSTAIIDDKNKLKPVADSLKDYFMPGILQGKVQDDSGLELNDIEIKLADGLYSVRSGNGGKYSFKVPAGQEIQLVIDASGYKKSGYKISLERGQIKQKDFILEPVNQSLLNKIRKYIRNILFSLHINK